MDKLSKRWTLKGALLCSGGMGGVACFLQHLCFWDGDPVPPARWLLHAGLASPQAVFNGFENYRSL